MATVGRRRKDSDSQLEPRVYRKGKSFYYFHRSGRWEPLGQDLTAANNKARVYNDPDGIFGTVLYWMRRFLIDCEQRVAAGLMSQRTLDDYREAIEISKRKDGKDKGGALQIFFAPPMIPTDVTPNHVKQFLELGARLKRSVRANREKACFSSFMSWLITTGEIPELKVNPCHRASGVKRNTEKKRERYVTHEEYRDVWNVAPASVQLMMVLTYRTLQRPESDIVLWDSTHLATEGGRRVLDFEQHKTGRRHRIALPADVDQLLQRATSSAVVKLRPPLVQTLAGEFYTYDGLCAMLKRAIAKANALRAERGERPMESFGFRDLKGKGATDMYYLDRRPIEEIQQLLGHAHKQTTEIYIKARWRETAEPNQVAL